MFLKSYRLFSAGFAALLFFVVFSVSAQANIPKKNISKSSAPKPAEVYAATEEDPHAPTVIDTSEPGETTPRIEASVISATAAVPVPIPVPAMMPTAAKFDPVPPTRVDSILKRVKLVEVLLKKYGRAYDYRTVSTQDLEKILAQLESAT